MLSVTRPYAAALAGTTRALRLSMQPETTSHAVPRHAEWTCAYRTALSHRNQPCFDLTFAVFDRLHTENEFTFGNEGVAPDAIQLYR